MHPLLDAFASMTLAPLVVYHTALSRGLVCYYEQAEAVAQLLESIAGGPGRAGDIPGQPTPTGLYLGKSLSHRKTIHRSAHGLLRPALPGFQPVAFQRGDGSPHAIPRTHRARVPYCQPVLRRPGRVDPVVRLPASGDRLHRPGAVRGGIVTVPGRIEEIGLKGVIQVSLVGENQKREVVVRGKAFVKQLKEVYQQGDPPQPA